MNYSQIMSPRSPLPRKVGGGAWPPSSYGSAAPGESRKFAGGVWKYVKFRHK